MATLNIVKIRINLGVNFPKKALTQALTMNVTGDVGLKESPYESNFGTIPRKRH